MSVRFRALACLGALAGWSLFCAVVSASPENMDWVARTWQSDDGLPDNNVTGIGQTSDGFLWITTQGGLARFDGLQFKRVSLPSLSGMPIEMIRALTVAKGDQLWMALEGGVVVCAGPNETKVYTDKLPMVRPSCITEDGKGAIWVGYSDGSVVCVAGNKEEMAKGRQWPPGAGWCWLIADARGQLWSAKAGRIASYQSGQFVPRLSMPERATCIGRARHEWIWICAGRTLYKYDGTGEPVKTADLPGGESVEPLTVYEDHSGNVWIGTMADGLFRFDGTRVTHLEMPGGEVRCVTEDAEGNIWAGMSGGGLNRLRPRVLRLVGMDKGLPFGTVRSVCEDAAGQLWVVTQNGVLVRGTENHWVTMGKELNRPGSQVSCVASDQEGAVAIGTTGNGLFLWTNGVFTAYRKNEGLASERVWAVMADATNGWWIALGGSNCVQRLRDGQFETFALPSGSLVVRAMTEDAAHRVWFGTEDGRLLRFDGTTLVDETRLTLARSVPIRCLQATPDGSLWIGYAGAGLGRLKDGRFARFGTEQGLPDDFISQIEPDGQGGIWFAGNRGIFEMRQSDLNDVAEGKSSRARPSLFGKNEGVPSLQANFGFGLGSVRTREGRIGFSMLTGLALLAPDKIRTNTVAPGVVIESVSVDGRKQGIPGASQLLGDELSVTQSPNGSQVFEVGPRHHELRIDFSALSFSTPENVRLRYKMEGLDGRWTETAQRSVVYPHVPAGNYRFSVTAENESGVWNDTGAVLPLLVRPYFWQTWWFRVLVIVGFTASLVAVGWYVSTRRWRREMVRMKQEAAVQKDRARIAKDLHDDLGAHLSQIAMLSELARTDLHKPAQALTHLDQIFHNSKLITRSLHEIVWALNPRNDTLDRFGAHVCQFSPDFLRAAGIRCRLDVPLELPPVSLAANVRHQLYLGLKEALNNIVRHSGATEVWLRLRVSEGKLTLVVEDNGRGFGGGAGGKGGENGLTNLRHRMEEIGGRFEYQSEANGGVRLIFVAPINLKSRTNSE